MSEETTIPCETCQEPTPMLGTKRCNNCWEVEGRMRGYLERGGEKARAFLLAALESSEPEGESA